MEILKNKMYNYEVAPPKDSWNNISSLLDKSDSISVISIANHKVSVKKINTKPFYYALVAASVLVMVMGISFWLNYSSNTKLKPVVSFMSFNKIPTQLANNYNLKKISGSGSNVSFSTDNIPQEKNISGLVSDYKNISDKDSIEAETKSKTYITIAGPEGQPVKISSKVATLIESSDNKYPPNAVWSSKINKWKNIMLANTLTPTATNFLDIAELSKTLGEKDN